MSRAIYMKRGLFLAGAFLTLLSVFVLLEQSRTAHAVTTRGRAVFARRTPSTAKFFVKNINETGTAFGATADKAFMADTDGDGVSEYGIWQVQATDTDGNGNLDGYFKMYGGDPVGTRYGISGDVPIVADYNGDGLDDFAIFRKSNLRVYILGQTNYVLTGAVASDIPLGGDFDGNGTAEPGVYRFDATGQGSFYYRTASGALSAGVEWGAKGTTSGTNDKPFVADFTGDGKVELGIVRPLTAGTASSTGVYFIKDLYRGKNTIQYGKYNDTPLVAYDKPWTEAHPDHFALVSANPQDNTPQLPFGDLTDANRVTPRAYAQVGNTMYVAGQFPAINGVTRTNIAAFNVATGALVSGFNPTVDGDINTIVATDDGNLVIGGAFSTVNGASRPKIAKLNPAGGLVSAFSPSISGGKVNEIVLSGDRLIVGGEFVGHLLALDPTSGANLNHINLTLTGTVPGSTGATGVDELAVSPADDKIVATGNFTAVNGTSRSQAFMVNLGVTSSTLSTWYSERFDKTCQTNVPIYMQDVAFSPNGAHFAMVSTGGATSQKIAANVGKLCDSVSYWPSNSSSSTSEPLWVNYAMDSMYSVVVTSRAVYVGGHINFLNNTYGTGGNPPVAGTCPAGQTCPPIVNVASFGAIDPMNGLAYSWSPRRDTNGHGIEALYMTAGGLWFGGDAVGQGQAGCSMPSIDGDCAGQPLETHTGIGFFPL